MLDKLFNFLNENSSLISFCPVCNNKFHSLQATVISERKNGYLLHVFCKKCQANLLTMVNVNQEGMNSVGLITDLMAGEVEKFYNQGSISSDDVLELHQLLEQKKVLIDKL